MSSEDSQARQEFTSEAEEILETLSRDLLELENRGREVRPELINKLFREVHSLKGLAGMLGFSEISDLSHNLEDMLDRLRMGKLEVTVDLVNVLYDSVDGLTRLVMSANDATAEVGIDPAALISRIHQLATARAGASESNALSEIDLDEQTRRSLTEYEEHRLVENVRSKKQLFSIEATFDFSDFDERLRKLSSDLAAIGEVLSTLPAIDSSGGTGISFRLLCATDLAADQVIATIGEGPSIRSLRRESPSAGALDPGADEEVSLRSMSRTVRVDIARLDHLMNIVGELIIEKSRLQALSKRPELLEFRAIAAELAKTSRNLERKLNDLQRSVIEVRMVPVGQIYSKVGRAVRKLARELGKEIELLLGGEETELDKMLVEELTDPLMHILRNALDHGIESGAERTAAGKPAKGRISLNAYQEGSAVVIDVSDDGRGVDPAQIREVALKRGLIARDEIVDAARAGELLFMPGFSTASAVSEISGRGVGLDVVLQNIQALKGSIELVTSVGVGTTFRIRLPITLAIIQALIVRAGGETYAIPLVAVSESLRLKQGEIETIESREVLRLRETTIPLLHLVDAFGIGSSPTGLNSRQFVVVTKSGDKTVGIVVDQIVGQQEIVIKSIGERLKKTAGIAGATETGDRELVLVVDVGSLVTGFGSAAREIRRGQRTTPV